MVTCVGAHTSTLQCYYVQHAIPHNATKSAMEVIKTINWIKAKNMQPRRRYPAQKATLAKWERQPTKLDFGGLLCGRSYM